MTWRGRGTGGGLVDVAGRTTSDRDTSPTSIRTVMGATVGAPEPRTAPVRATYPQ